MTFIESQLEDALRVPCTSKLAKEPHNSFCLIVQKAERRIAQFTNEDVGRVKVLTYFLEHNRLFGLLANKNNNFLTSVCAERISDLSTSCINYCANSNFVSKGPPQEKSIYHGLPQLVLERTLAVLRDKMKTRATKLQTKSFS